MNELCFADSSQWKREIYLSFELMRRRREEAKWMEHQAAARQVNEMESNQLLRWLARAIDGWNEMVCFLLLFINSSSFSSLSIAAIGASNWLKREDKLIKEIGWLWAGGPSAAKEFRSIWFHQTPLHPSWLHSFIEEKKKVSLFVFFDSWNKRLMSWVD